MTSSYMSLEKGPQLHPDLNEDSRLNTNAVIPYGKFYLSTLGPMLQSCEDEFDKKIIHL